VLRRTRGLGLDSSVVFHPLGTVRRRNARGASVAASQLMGGVVLSGEHNHVGALRGCTLCSLMRTTALDWFGAGLYTALDDVNPRLQWQG